MENGSRRMCRPGGLEITEALLRLAGLDQGGNEWKERTAVKVLDIGCGEGATIEYLRTLRPDWEISGYDPDPAVRLEGMVERGRAEALPVSDGSVDLLLMECSLSKTEDPKKALAEAFRVLKPDGWLLISDMYARRREAAFDGMLGRLCLAGHIRDWLTAAGFVIAEMEDVSESLIQWIGQQIMDGQGDQVYSRLGADRLALKEAGCGYFICAAQPSPLWSLLSYVEERSPFYKKRLAESGCTGIRPGDWERFKQIPFTVPEDIKEHPEAFLCVPAKEIARIITLKTSGSSGAPKRLFFTEEDLMRTADFFEKGMQYMVSPGDRVIVYMEGPGLFSIGGLLREGLRRIGVEVKVHGLIRDLEAAAGDGADGSCFVGTAGQMYALAVHAPGLKPRTVLLSADYVPHSVKQFLERTWNCRVFTHWGMTETGYGGGVQCGAREGYHMRDRDLFLEIVDPDTGCPVPEGEYGELVLTAMTRKGMPLIRYRTGDLSRFLTEPCGCGCLKPRLAEVEGRLDDVIRLPGGKLLSIHRLDELLLSSGVIQDFQAEYDRENRIRALPVLPVKGDGTIGANVSAKKTEQAAVRAAWDSLSEYYGDVLKVQITVGEVSPYIGSGKRRLTKRPSMHPSPCDRKS